MNSKLRALEAEMQGKYLTEEYLGKFLEAAYPNKEWEHDKRFKGIDKTYNFRPDFCCHELKLCVEFDGPDHYMKANVILADENKDNVLKALGYKVIRIPYFVQLDNEAIKYFFGLDIEFNYGFKHGFIAKNVSLPANFCELGIWKFKDFLFHISDTKVIFPQIKESIRYKIDRMKRPNIPLAMGWLSVIPSSLFLTLDYVKHNYDSVENWNQIESTLANNWNCVMLEGTQGLLDQAVYNMDYIYNSKGNISGCSFSILVDSVVWDYKFLVEEDIEDEDIVRTYVYINGELKYSDIFEKDSVNLFNLVDIIFQ